MAIYTVELLLDPDHYLPTLWRIHVRDDDDPYQADSSVEARGEYRDVHEALAKVASDRLEVIEGYRGLLCGPCRGRARIRRTIAQIRRDIGTPIDIDHDYSQFRRILHEVV